MYDNTRVKCFVGLEHTHSCLRDSAAPPGVQRLQKAGQRCVHD